jgi:phospholipid/cholesterol/gamma-HCH transport system ATP-binding protein
MKNAQTTTVSEADLRARFASVPPLVQLRDVALRFGDRAILEHLNLSVARGERLAVLGPSGTGKSTLLRLLIGTLPPDAGTVTVKGFDVARLKRRKLIQLRMHVGMVFQYSALISSMTVRENLALPLEELTRKSASEIEAIVDEKLEFVGLPETKYLRPDELSGGMKKRIAVARALVLEPELLLFDEPTAGLDPVASSVIDNLILGLGDRTNATCIIVTHELASAFRIASRMAMLYHGRIIEEAEPAQFKRSRNPLVAQFLSGATHGPMTDEHEGKTVAA